MTYVDLNVKVIGHFKMLLVATLCLLNLVPIGEGAGHRNYWDMTFTVVVPPETPEQCYHIPDIKFRQDVDVFFQASVEKINCFGIWMKDRLNQSIQYL